jgi:hypothetical protein
VAPADETLRESAPADTTACSDSSDLPKQIGRFKIQGRLGAGAFGVVYRAYDPRLDRRVALKVPHPATLQDSEARARFLREPKVVARLRHPSIVPVFDAGVDGDTYYMASALVDGETLRDAMDRERFGVSRAISLVRDLAEALDYAHREGIVHRDVRPANIMLDSTGSPLLMDFGLARHVESQETLTHDGTVLGTPAYMAPEQASGQRDRVGPHSDQYSLGAVLYELLCGRTPYCGSAESVILEVIRGQPPRPRSIDRAVPWELEAICLKAMSKDPQHRYTRCRELADDLRRWHAKEPVLASDVGPLDVMWGWCRRNPRTAAHAVAAVVLVLILAIAVNTASVLTSKALDDATTERQLAEEALADIDRMENSKNAVFEALQIDSQKSQALAEMLPAAVARRREALSGIEQLDSLRHALDTQLNRLKRDVEPLRQSKERLQQELAGIKARIQALQVSVREDKNRLPDPSTAYLTFKSRGKRIWTVAFSPTGHHILAIVLDSNTSKHNLVVWNALDGREVFAGSSHVYHAAYSPDGRRIVVSMGRQGGQYQFNILDAQNGEILRTLSTLSAHAATFSPDGRWIVGCGSKTTTVFDSQTYAIVDVPWVRMDIGHVQVSSDSRRLLGTRITRTRLANSRASKTEYETSLFDAQSGQKVAALGSLHPRRTAFSPDGQQILCVGGRGDVSVFDAVNGQHIRGFPLGESVSRCVAFGPEGRRIAGGSGRRLKVWDSISGRELRDYERQGWSVSCVAFCPRGIRIVSGHDDGSVRLWIAPGQNSAPQMTEVDGNGS